MNQYWRNFQSSATFDFSQMLRLYSCPWRNFSPHLDFLSTHSALQWSHHCNERNLWLSQRLRLPAIHFTRATTGIVLSHIYCDTVEALVSATFDSKSKFAPHSHLGAKCKFLEDCLSATTVKQCLGAMFDLLEAQPLTTYMCTHI